MVVGGTVVAAPPVEKREGDCQDAVVGLGGGDGGGFGPPLTSLPSYRGDRLSSYPDLPMGSACSSD